MKTLNIDETGINIASIFSEVEKNGEFYLVCRNGKPIAEITPLKAMGRLAPHPIMSKIEINYDPTESLTHDEWPEMIDVA